jgi:hypothetical protein
MTWKELAATSPYQTALAVEKALQHGDAPEATEGIQELIEALSRSDQRALKCHLIRLMVHVIKWQTQTDKRSRGWRSTIRNARREIRDIQEDTPSLNRAAIQRMWQSCFEAAKEEAEAEMNLEALADAPTWEDVFEKEYEINKG